MENMRATTTDGKEAIGDMCPFCCLDAAGNHASDCLNNPIKYSEFMDRLPGWIREEQELAEIEKKI